MRHLERHFQSYLATSLACLRLTPSMPPIPIIDLFAGPGGLGEGFSSLPSLTGGRRFRIALSIEKDPKAHQTLALRAFFRQFPLGDVPEEYYQFVRAPLQSGQMVGAYPKEARAAEREAWLHEMSPESASVVTERIGNVLGNTDQWVLIGGPPCQAYSLAGRSRNSGVEGYDPAKDRRQTLYLEYLQIIADHGPPVFVMENVKGLLSATLGKRSMFARIIEDLRQPADAIRAAGRSVRRGAAPHRYRVVSLAPFGSLLDDEPRDFVVQAEDHGVPQARHRVILLGIRDDISRAPSRLTVQSNRTSVATAIGNLPKVRSGLSDREDSAENWRSTLAFATPSGWLKRMKTRGDRETAQVILETIEELRLPPKDRGDEFLDSTASPRFANAFLGDERLEGVLNHSTRSHIHSDLHRYLFAASFAKVHGRSPQLADFPVLLRPKHSNVAEALKGEMFADRFRVQLAGKPSTTITSHISKDGHYYIHYDPSQCRSLTVREAARLQTFPDNYFFCGGRTAQYSQVGNAVPPLLARQIAEIVSALLS